MAVSVISQLQISGQIQYGLSQASTFGSISLPATTESFSLVNPNLTTFNCLYLNQFSITTQGTQDINLNSFADWISGSTNTMGHALAIQVLSQTAGIRLSPGGTNPLQWFFGTTATTGYVTVKPWSANNAGFLWADDPTIGTAGLQAVTSGAGTLRLAGTGAGTSTAVVQILVVGTTT